MSGRGFRPDFIFAWPNARTAVMGGEQAAKVLSIVNREKIIKEGRQPSPQEESKFAAMEAAVIGQFDRESQALAGTARLYDDGLIDPRDTRRVLAMTLSICHEGRTRVLQANSYGVARF